MGFHTCEWCKAECTLKDAHIFRATSSQDVVLHFEGGNSWAFPHTGLLHYVTSHGYRPPEAFILDVMTREVKRKEIAFTKGVTVPTKIGYLQHPEEIPQGDVPDGFVERLSNLCLSMWGTNNLRQTRGVSRD